MKPIFRGVVLLLIEKPFFINLEEVFSSRFRTVIFCFSLLLVQIEQIVAEGYHQVSSVLNRFLRSGQKGHKVFVSLKKGKCTPSFQKYEPR